MLTLALLIFEAGVGDGAGGAGAAAASPGTAAMEGSGGRRARRRRLGFFPPARGERMDPGWQGLTPPTCVSTGQQEVPRFAL